MKSQGVKAAWMLALALMLGGTGCCSSPPGGFYAEELAGFQANRRTYAAQFTAESGWQSDVVIEVRQMADPLIADFGLLKPPRFWDQIYSGYDELAFGWQQGDRLDRVLDDLLTRLNESSEQGELKWTFIEDRLVIHGPYGVNWLDGGPHDPTIRPAAFFLASIIHNERVRALQKRIGTTVDGRFGPMSAEALIDHLKQQGVDCSEATDEDGRIDWDKLRAIAMDYQGDTGFPGIGRVDIVPFSQLDVYTY
jgi:hypothetical protein